MRDPIEELANIPFPETVVDQDLLEQVHRRGNRLRRRRTVFAPVAGVAAVGAIAAPLALAAGLGGPAGTTVSTGPAATGNVSVTLDARFCEGCEFQLHQGAWDDQAPSGATVWHSDKRTVHDGRVSFTVPKARTQGMSITFSAPWEGQLAGTSTVVMGYQGHTDDADVSSAEARASKAASACWSGTEADAITIGIATEKVQTDGVHERVPGTRAYTFMSMDDVEPPMREIADGVLSSADDNICGLRP